MSDIILYHPILSYILYYPWGLNRTNFVGLLWFILILLSCIILFATSSAVVRTVGSGELLECAQNVLSMSAISQLRAGEPSIPRNADGSIIIRALHVLIWSIYEGCSEERIEYERRREINTRNRIKLDEIKWSLRT